MFYNNLSGTTATSFKIGKGGVTIFQGSSDPTVTAPSGALHGDIYIKSGTGNSSYTNINGTWTLTSGQNYPGQSSITTVGTITSGTWAGTLATTGGSITGVTLDNSVIGGTTPDAATFTSLATTGASSFGGNLNMNSHSITGLVTPTTSDMATSKSYVDQAIITGQHSYGEVAALFNTNTTISSPGTLTDGTYTVVANDRILLIGQTTGSQNGIWIYNTSTTALTRPVDYASGSTQKSGLFVFVGNGTSFGNTGYVLSTNNVTVDTTSTVWSQFTSLGSISVSSPITQSGSTIGFSPTYAGNTSISSVGTITTGTWASALAATSGTVTGLTSVSTSGLTLSGHTISLTGSFFTFGASAYSLQFNLAGNTILGLPTTGTLVSTNNNLSVFNSTTSAQLAGVISDETGTGPLVFGTSPTIATPSISSPTITGSITGTGILANSGLVNSSVTIGTTNIALGATGASLAGVTDIGTGTLEATGNVTVGGTLGVTGIATFAAEVIAPALLVGSGITPVSPSAPFAVDETFVGVMQVSIVNNDATASSGAKLLIATDGATGPSVVVKIGQVAGVITGILQSSSAAVGGLELTASATSAPITLVPGSGGIISLNGNTTVTGTLGVSGAITAASITGLTNVSTGTLEASGIVTFTDYLNLGANAAGASASIPLYIEFDNPGSQTIAVINNNDGNITNSQSAIVLNTSVGSSRVATVNSGTSGATVARMNISSGSGNLGGISIVAGAAGAPITLTPGSGGLVEIIGNGTVSGTFVITGATTVTGVLTMGNSSAINLSNTGTGAPGSTTTNGQGTIYTGSNFGLELRGNGSSNDVTLFNNAGTAALSVLTGTTNVAIAGNETVGGTLTVTGVSSLAATTVTGNLTITGAEANTGISYQTPTSGTTLTIPNNIAGVQLLHLSTISSLTIPMPSTPVDGQKFTISSIHGISTLTMTSSATITTPLTAPAQSGTTMASVLYGTWRYSAANVTWYRIS